MTKSKNKVWPCGRYRLLAALHATIAPPPAQPPPAPNRGHRNSSQVLAEQPEPDHRVCGLGQVREGVEPDQLQVEDQPHRPQRCVQEAPDGRVWKNLTSAAQVTSTL